MHIMKQLLRVLATPLLATSFISAACAQLPTQTPQQSSPVVKVSFDLLSDTGEGNALTPYLHALNTEFQRQWTRNISVADLQASKAQYETTLSLSLTPDGNLSAVKLDHPTRDAALDRAAWAATTSATYAPLPSAMQGASLKLRVHFLVD